ncbi:hypothetical protein VTK56DRAFT_2617 [Thermocarpiscus australiensis]
MRVEGLIKVSIYTRILLARQRIVVARFIARKMRVPSKVTVRGQSRIREYRRRRRRRRRPPPPASHHTLQQIGYSNAGGLVRQARTFGGCVPGAKPSVSVFGSSAGNTNMGSFRRTLRCSKGRSAACNSSSPLSPSSEIRQKCERLIHKLQG